MFENYNDIPNCIFLIYESFFNNSYIKKFKIDLNFSNMDMNIFKNSNKKNINIRYDKDIYENALKIYNNFTKLY